MKAVNVRHDLPRAPVRPVQGRKTGLGGWEVLDPIINRWVHYRNLEIDVLGEWDGISHYHLNNQEATWAQYARHQLGTVLKQNQLAERLNELGFKRFDLEPYIIDSFYSPYRYRFQFTYDELENLLGRVE